MIDSPEKLEAYLTTLCQSPWVAVDTEADSLHAYPEKICLVQVSTPTDDRLIDPLSSISMDRFLAELSRHELIMHGADYDLRLLRKHHDFSPKTIFDTMLAARLLGSRQFSLSSLVEHYLGVKLEKGSQKANWAVRPLTERMERYARNDTHHLKPLADRLRDELKAKGRLSWHAEYCAWLVAESARANVADPDAEWRLKGSSLLDRAGLAVLRELWRWREKEALGANRPPFFVASHEVLLDLARVAATGAAWEPLVPRHISERRRAGIAKAIMRAQSLPSDQYPKPQRYIHRRPSEGERRRYHELQYKRDARAAELGIDPTLIASRAVISDLSHDWEKHSPTLMNWQRLLLSS